MRTTQRGVTLIEVMISMVILSVVVLISMMILADGTTGGTNASIENALVGRNASMLQRLREELAFAKTLSVSTDHTRISYQVVISVTAQGSRVLGYRDADTGAGNAGWHAEIYTETSEVIKESSGSVSVTFSGTPVVYGIDLNHDGDTSDTWAVCKLKMAIYDAGVDLIAGNSDDVLQSTRDLDDDLVLVPVSSSDPTLQGDVDGGGNDMLFVLRDGNGTEVVGSSLAQKRVSVTMFHGHLDAKGTTMIIRQGIDNIRLDLKQ